MWEINATIYQQWIFKLIVELDWMMKILIMWVINTTIYQPWIFKVLNSVMKLLPTSICHFSGEGGSRPPSSRFLLLLLALFGLERFCSSLIFPAEARVSQPLGLLEFWVPLVRLDYGGLCSFLVSFSFLWFWQENI
jgi:hypothetical protein